MVNPVKYVVSFTIRAFPAGGREDLPLNQKDLEEYADKAIRSWATLVPQSAIDYEHCEDVTLLMDKAKIKRTHR